MGDPWALAEGGRPPRPAGGTASGSARKRGGLGGLVDTVTKASPVKRDADNGHFTGPFVMAAFNSRIVARSASLLGYGTAFRYVEYTDFGAGARGAVTAGVASVALVAGLAGLAFGPTRAVLDRVLPKPGEGPSLEAQEKGRLRVDVIAEATNGARYRTTVTVPYDPGYLGTAYMLGQAALSLVEDGDRAAGCRGRAHARDRAGCPARRPAAGAPLHAGDRAPSRLTAAAIRSASIRSSRSIPEMGLV